MGAFERPQRQNTPAYPSGSYATTATRSRARGRRAESMTTAGRCPTPRTRRREARGAVLAGFALVLPPLVRLCRSCRVKGWLRPALRPVPPCGRTAAYGLPLTRHPLNTTPNALKRPTARFLAPTLPGCTRSPQNGSQGFLWPFLRIPAPTLSLPSHSGVPAWPFRPRKGAQPQGAGRHAPRRGAP